MTRSAEEIVADAGLSRTAARQAAAALRAADIDIDHRYQEAGGHFAGTGLYLRRPLEETR